MEKKALKSGKIESRKKTKLIAMLVKMPSCVKKILANLPRDDYRVLDTFKFVSIWLHYALDQSEVSMRSLLKKLNIQGEKVHLSTFSKASKKRSPEIFKKIFEELRKKLNSCRDNSGYKLGLFPLDSTVVTLTSKLLHEQGINQVKLFAGLNLESGEIGGVKVNFGQGHDSKYGDETIEATPENQVAVMDRGFSSLERIKKLMKEEKRYFVLRINRNFKVEKLENGKGLLGSGKEKIEVRIVEFFDRESGKEFRLVTNLPSEEEGGVDDKEISEIYRHRWQIELLWKFLKMHLKLDQLITKNLNGIEIQIYVCLIAYLMLKLIKIPQEFGEKLLDKLRYLQACMCDQISYVHWLPKLVFF